MSQRWEGVAGVWTLPLTPSFFEFTLPADPYLPVLQGARPKATDADKTLFLTSSQNNWNLSWFEYDLLFARFHLEVIELHSFSNSCFPLLEFFRLKIENTKLTEETVFCDNNMFWDENAQICENEEYFEIKEGWREGRPPQSFQR